jgi:hypothetical protein
MKVSLQDRRITKFQPEQQFFSSMKMETENETDQHKRIYCPVL